MNQAIKDIFNAAETVFANHDAVALRVLANMQRLGVMDGFGWCSGDITVGGLIFVDVGRKAINLGDAVFRGEKSIDDHSDIDAQLATIASVVEFLAASVAKCTAAAEKLLNGEWPEFDGLDQISFIGRQMDLAAKMQATARAKPCVSTFKLLNIIGPVSEVMAHVVGTAADLKADSRRYHGYIRQINDILVAQQPVGLDLPAQTGLCFLSLAYGISTDALTACEDVKSILFGL